MLLVLWLLFSSPYKYLYVYTYLCVVCAYDISHSWLLYNLCVYMSSERIIFYIEIVTEPYKYSLYYTRVGGWQVVPIFRMERKPLLT